MTAPESFSIGNLPEGDRLRLLPHVAMILLMVEGYSTGSALVCLEFG